MGSSVIEPSGDRSSSITRSQITRLAGFGPDRDSLQKTVAFAFGLDFRVFCQCQMNQAPLGGGQRRQKLWPARAFRLLRRAQGELFQGLALMRPEPLGIQAGIDGAAQLLVGDPSG